MAVITSTITNNCDATVTAAIQLPSWPPDSWEPACKAALVACGFRREGTQSYYYRNSNHPAVVAAIETGLLQLGICFRTSDWGVDAIKEYLAPVADAVEAELIRVTLYLRATQDTLDIEKIRSRLAGAEYLRDVLASNENDFKALEEDTVAFVRWLLARDDGLQPVLENLEPRQATTRITTTRASLRQLVERIGDPRVGICWDLGHDVLSGSTAPPEAAWLGLVRHVHLHDIDEQGHDHCPLMFGRVPGDEWLRPLIEAGYSGAVTLEISRRELAHLPHDRQLAVLAGSVRVAVEAVGGSGH